MTYLLDTNACIKYLNGRSERIRKNLESRKPEEMVVCSVVKAELYYGAMKSAKPKKNIERISRFLDAFVSLPFDDHAADAYGQIRAKLEKSGTPIGPNDLLIAAIAISNDVTLVTNNVEEFARVDGLALEDWESDNT